MTQNFKPQISQMTQKETKEVRGSNRANAESTQIRRSAREPHLTPPEKSVSSV
jgi:hypothetical protein